MEFSIFGKDFYLKVELVIVVALSLSLVCGIAGYGIGASKELGISIDTSKDNYNQKADIQKDDEVKSVKSVDDNQNINKKDDEQNRNYKETSLQDIVKVYIVGCVNKPGLFKIPKGSVLFEAVALAGGATDKADLDNINMAYTINENCMIKVYAKKSASIKSKTSEINNTKKSKNGKSQIKTVAKPTSSAIKKPDNTNEGYAVVTDSGNSLVGEKAQDKEAKEQQTSKININTAGVEALDTLSGIGPSTAADIISYRERSGGFKRIEDIMKVPGIKEKTFSKIKDQISV